MEKSTQKFLSLILCIALLLSFPIVSQAAGKSYKETFTGTYTAPEKSRNVLVSGATISEWYGDRVNMNGHTYSVRQNEYGLNKDGNMIDVELDNTYTLWLAQYGVASLVFTANREGDYAFYSSDAGYGESPNYFNIEIYSYDEETTADKKYTLREREYGTFNHEKNGYSQDKQAYVVIHLTRGEKIYIAASADTDYDHVYNLTAEKWTRSTCKHSWITTEYGERNASTCTRSVKQECRYCQKKQTINKEAHSYSCKATPIGNDLYKEVYVCEDCGKKESDYEYITEHNYVRKETTKGCVTRHEWVCEGCGKVEDYWEEDDHDYEWKSSKDGCTVTEYKQCTKCGYIDEDSKYSYTEHTWPDEPKVITKGCHVTNIYYCAKCGEEMSRDEYDSHVMPDDVEIDGCKYTYTCEKCHKNVVEYRHQGEEDESYVREGCVTYKVYTCSECGEETDRLEWETNHNYEYFCEFDAEKNMNHEGYRCSECGEIDWEEWREPSDYDDYDDYDDYTFTVDGHRYSWDNYKRTEKPISDDCDCKKIVNTFTCLDCGKTYNREYISHRGSLEYTQVTPQHDKVCGTYNYTCTECGKFEYEENLTCHSFVESKDASGNPMRTCRRCGAKETGYHTHDFSSVKTKPATCTEAGKTFRICFDCQKEEVISTTPALGHQWNNGTVLKAATCTTDGVKLCTCNRCKQQGRLAIKAKGHTVVVDKAVKPTRKKTGLTEGKHCSVCHAVLVAQQVIPKVGPTPTLKSIKASGKKLVIKLKKKAKGVTGYQVQYSTKKNFKKAKSKKIKGAKKTKLTIKGIKKKKTYYVRIRTYTTKKGQTSYSKWSKVKKIKVK